MERAVYPNLQHYELRFPRIEKVYRPTERSWKDTTSLDDLHKVACAAVGRDRSDKDIKDWANSLWGKHSSPSIRSPRKRKARADIWYERLDTLTKKAKVCHGKSIFTAENKWPMPHGTVQPLTSRTNLPKSQTLHPDLWGKTVDDGAQHVVALLTPPTQHEIAVQKGANKVSSQQTTSPAAVPTQGDLRASRWMGTLVWFTSPGSKCSSCQLWKKKIPREGRLHSLESLLVGCGRMSRADVPKQGMVIIDENDEDAGKWREKVAEILRTHGNHVPVVILGCKSTS